MAERNRPSREGSDSQAERRREASADPFAFGSVLPHRKDDLRSLDVAQARQVASRRTDRSPSPNVDKTAGNGDSPSPNVDKPRADAARRADPDRANVDKTGTGAGSARRSPNVDAGRADGPDRANVDKTGTGAIGPARKAGTRGKRLPAEEFFSFMELDDTRPSSGGGTRNRDVPDEWREVAAGRRSTVARPDTGREIATTTGEYYLRRARDQERMYRRQNDIPADAEIDLTEFANWLLSRKPHLRPSTWRVYKNACVYMIESTGDAEADNALRLLNTDFVELTDEGAAEPGKAKASGRGRRTSAMKAFKWPYEDFRKIIAYIENFSRSDLASETVDWLRAGVATGLRPIEWEATALRTERMEEGGEPREVLKVLNAKATQGRGNDIIRTLDVTDVDETYKDAISRMSRNGATWYAEGVFQERKAKAQQIIYNAFQKLFPNRRQTYCLYTCRHQFIANAKSACSRAEVAALSGHGVTKTAERHYGKKRSAWSPDRQPGLPRPHPQEVELVRRRIGYMENRVRQAQEAGLSPGEGDGDESFPI